MRLRTLISLGGVALALAGCGLRGDLERPDPLWGEAGADAAAADEDAPEDPNAPVPIDPPDRR